MADKTIFCVYFDKGFLQKGLALHSSLIKHLPTANLWILALDKYTEKILKKMKLKGVTIVPLSEFEDRELKVVKPTRSLVEYYWTCSPSWPLYVIKKNPGVKYVTYLDADLYFFSSAMDGVDEIGSGSLLAVEHRFPKSLEGLAKRNGRFNLAFNVFKNDAEGLACLKRWRKQCLDWCYWKPEEGKMGDQGYLDEWPKLYKNLVISQNLGLDAAPWNVTQYSITKKGQDVFVNKDKLVCYHFHQFQVTGPDSFNRVFGYTLPKNVVDFIYKPYEAEMEKNYKLIKKYDPSFTILKPKITAAKMFRQKLAKFVGPIYWRIIAVVGSLRSPDRNEK